MMVYVATFENTHELSQKVYSRISKCKTSEQFSKENHGGKEIQN